MIDVTIIKETKKPIPLSKKEIVIVIGEVLKSEKIKTATNLSVVVVSTLAIQKKNNSYRKVNKATDILSFPHDNLYLGELLLCPEYIKNDYIQYEHSLKSHYIRLLVHGTMHLLGYDHIKLKDFNVMSVKEKVLLTKLGKIFKLRINF